MALSAEQKTQLIDLLVANMPVATFAEIVRQQGIVADYDLLRKQAPENPTDARRFVVTRVVEAYDAAGKVRRLATSIYRRTYLDDQLAPRIYPFIALDTDPAMDDRAKEAAIVNRANTMSSQALRRFLDENEAKICLVLAANDDPDAEEPLRMGTGFLVGPDIVLTAYHTLADHISNSKQQTPAPGPCWAIFDFYEGDPVTLPNCVPSGATRVAFAEQWLIDSKPDMPRDGLFLQPDPNQLTELPTRLDFALIKLAEPVGKQARQRSGGARRSWLKLSAAAVALAQSDRIIIPQHPQGYPQRIDFGRFSRPDSDLDTSATRLRYDTETDHGTSGAPCFNQNFSLVGMHNAAFKPNGVDVRKNQAIRIDRILAALSAVPGQTDPESAPSRLWNAATEAEPQVILGRQTLIDWLEAAQSESPRGSKERVYAASIKPEGLANHHNFGKTFTIDILKAARRGSAEPIVLLGTDDDPLPETVPDLVRAIGFQLGISTDVLDTMPPRPSAALPSSTPNADKLRRWASEDIPLWFDGVLGRFRESTVDLRVEAQRRIDVLRAANVPPSAEDVALAAQPAPQLDTRRRWSIAWIVMSGLLNQRLNEEVRDLLAGVVGGKLTESSMPQQLRRLRWLFVGYVPDFLSAEQVMPEVLDPMAIGREQLLEGVTRLADSNAFDVNADGLAIASGLIDFALEEVPAAKDPTRRLTLFQRSLFPKVQARISKARVP